MPSFQREAYEHPQKHSKGVQRRGGSQRLEARPMGKPETQGKTCTDLLQTDITQLLLNNDAQCDSEDISLQKVARENPGLSEQRQAPSSEF